MHDWPDPLSMDCSYPNSELVGFELKTFEQVSKPVSPAQTDEEIEPFFSNFSISFLEGGQQVHQEGSGERVRREGDLATEERGSPQLST